MTISKKFKQNTRCIGNIVIKENILLSQRAEEFVIEARVGGAFREIYRGTIIGHKKIIPLKGVKADALRISVAESRCEPVIAFVGIYRVVFCQNEQIE